MMGERLNAEGYKDPTAYDALTKVAQEKMKYSSMPLVYICSPLRGDVSNNTRRAQLYSRFAVERGYLPITPHIYFPQFLDDEKGHERRKAFFMNKVLFSKCRELWVFGDYISEGMQTELNWAIRKRLPIKYFTEDLEEKREHNV